MAKKRGLGSNRGLDALLGSIKREKTITTALTDTLTDNASLNLRLDTSSDDNAQSTVNSDFVTNDSVKSEVATNIKPSLGKRNNSANVINTPSTDVVNDADINLIKIDIRRLQSGKYQPRRDMSEPALAELSESIRQHGIMQPIVIRPLLANEDKTDEQVTHEIIAGERRWRAAKMAGETHIPAIERVLSDELAIALALIENIQREDLTIMEQAEALQRFHSEFDMSHAMIADVVGKARTTVSNLLRLNQLHDDIKVWLNQGDIDMGHARTLLSLSQEQQPIIGKKIIEQAMTVREAEKLVKSILKPERKSSEQAQQQRHGHDIERLNQRLSDHFGAVVKLKQKANGKGSVEIFFDNAEELSQLLSQMHYQES